MTTSMLAKLPEPVRVVVDSVKPALVGAAALAVGAGAAMVGGELLRQIDAVEDFAAGGDLQDAAVNVAGGVIIDGAIIAGVAAFKDAKTAKLLAPPLLVGTIAAAAAEAVVPHLEAGVDAVLNLFGLGDDGDAPAAPNPGGLYDNAQHLLNPPGGTGGNIYDAATPGGLYGEAAYPSSTTAW